MDCGKRVSERPIKLLVMQVLVDNFPESQNFPEYLKISTFGSYILKFIWLSSHSYAQISTDRKEIKF